MFCTNPISVFPLGSVSSYQGYSTITILKRNWSNSPIKCKTYSRRKITGFFCVFCKTPNGHSVIHLYGHPSAEWTAEAITC